MKFIASRLLRSMLVASVSVGTFVGCADNDGVGGSEADLATTPVDATTTKLPARLDDVRKAIGVAEFKNSGCTVGYIGKGYALSAGHCFKDAFNADGRETIFFLREQNSSSKVRIKFPEEGIETMGYVVDGELSRTTDFAILRLEGDLPKHELKVRYDAKPQLGTELTMLSYPAEWVRGESKWDLSLEQPRLIWSQVCSWLDASKMNEPFGIVDITAPTIFAHQCAAHQGSSGAPVLDWKTLEVVGIFNGFLESYYEGRLDDVNYGQAVSTTPIRQYLEEIPAPRFTVDTVADGEKTSATWHVAGEVYDFTVNDTHGDIASVVYTVYPLYEAYGTETKVTAAPFTFHYDGTKVEGRGPTLHAVVTGKNGASASFTRILRY